MKYSIKIPLLIARRSVDGLWGSDLIKRAWLTTDDVIVRSDFCVKLNATSKCQAFSSLSFNLHYRRKGGKLLWHPRASFFSKLTWWDNAVNPFQLFFFSISRPRNVFSTKRRKKNWGLKTFFRFSPLLRLHPTSRCFTTKGILDQKLVSYDEGLGASELSFSS